MIKSLAAPSFFLVLATSAFAEADLLSYWNFNNSTKNSVSSLGTFKTDPALFGEAYNEETKHLASNTNFNTVFHGDNIYLDLSTLGTDPNASASRGWGVFLDTRANKLRQDDSEGGSLMAGAANNNSHMTFVLSSEGYKDLAFSYAHRANDASLIQWSFSTDGKTFTPIKDSDENTAFSKQVINLSGEGGLGLTQLDNQKTIYLRATLIYPGAPAGTIAIDNFQFTGSR